MNTYREVFYVVQDSWESVLYEQAAVDLSSAEYDVSNLRAGCGPL